MMKLQELNIKIWDHAKVLLILFRFPGWKNRNLSDIVSTLSTN